MVDLKNPLKQKSNVGGYEYEVIYTESLVYDIEKINQLSGYRRIISITPDLYKKYFISDQEHLEVDRYAIVIEVAGK